MTPGYTLAAGGEAEKQHQATLHLCGYIPLPVFPLPFCLDFWYKQSMTSD
jgi:hypothetical protein